MFFQVFRKLPFVLKLVVISIFLAIIFFILYLTTRKTVSPTIPLSLTEKRQSAKVIRVIDGDTIQIEGGRVVRYIGIDSPELAISGKPDTCFSNEAKIKNKELVEGKVVELLKDVSETDQYGRLLRYVYLNETMVNELLMREGYAVTDPFPPDIKYQEKFLTAEREAKADSLGIWKACPCLAKQNCYQMLDCSEAKYYFETCGTSDLDADQDGVPCDDLCQF